MGARPSASCGAGQRGGRGEADGDPPHLEPLGGEARGRSPPPPRRSSRRDEDRAQLAVAAHDALAVAVGDRRRRDRGEQRRGEEPDRAAAAAHPPALAQGQDEPRLGARRGAAQAEAAAVPRRHPPHDPQAVAVRRRPRAAFDGGAAEQRGSRCTPAIAHRQTRTEISLAGVTSTAISPAVLEGVADQVVHRLGKLDPVASQLRLAGAPAQPQRPSVRPPPAAPALDRRLDHRPASRTRAAPASRRAAVDLALEAIDRGGGHLQRRPIASAPAPNRRAARAPGACSGRRSSCIASFSAAPPPPLAEGADASCHREATPPSADRRLSAASSTCISLETPRVRSWRTKGRGPRTLSPRTATGDAQNAESAADERTPVPRSGLGQAHRRGRARPSRP